MKILDKEKEKYENIHSSYEYGLGLRQVNDLKNLNYEYSKSFLDIIKSSDTCLDIACGGGTIMDYVSNLDCTPTGIDISENAIKKVNPKFKTYMGSCHSLPFPNQHFDTVYFLDGLEHIPKEIESESISESFRVAKNYVCHGIAMNSSIRNKIELHINIKTAIEWKNLFDFIAPKFNFKESLYYTRNTTVYLIYKNG